MTGAILQRYHLAHRLIDEYIRRQMMSAHDYAEFLAQLKQDFPGEPFLIVRFGDHQPWLSADVLEPNRSDEAKKFQNIRPVYAKIGYGTSVSSFATRVKMTEKRTVLTSGMKMAQPNPMTACL